MDNQWVCDMAHNLNDDLIDDYFKLWELIELEDLNLQDQFLERMI